MKACDSENQDARALESEDQKVANQGKTYIKPFWKEIQLVQTPKNRENKNSKESSWFGEPRCKARVQDQKVANQGWIYIALFSRESQLVQTLEKKESS
jgi:hypothetical protein